MTTIENSFLTPALRKTKFHFNMELALYTFIVYEVVVQTCLYLENLVTILLYFMSSVITAFRLKTIILLKVIQLIRLKKGEKS